MAGVPLRVAEYLGAQSGDDVREDVLDLVAHSQKDHDDDDRNQDKNQGIFDHALAALSAAQPATQFLLPSFLAGTRA